MLQHRSFQPLGCNLHIKLTLTVTSYNKIQQPQSPLVNRMCMTLFGSLLLIISREYISLIVELVKNCLVLPKLSSTFTRS